ncbi:tRNA glutamyl-Q(34) synthetase GluQRS [Methylobacter sp. Wu8]|uniref:tRNA glutamyl-Q(34) synthetase GluQRS n=1 Tax=Methylobacter sp. Wu8 TaxID=3118457 RepID=UPI002F311E41
MDKQPIIGRFAPSPTGPLHLGSLYTALAGFLQARSQQGQWLLRIDDLDTPRNVQGSADAILETLEIFGLHWDGTVYYQSRYIDIYNDIISDLQKNKLIYPCTCSRKELTTGGREQARPDIYPGICRDRQAPPDVPHALRIKADSRIITFQDELQGLISHNLAEQDGDFIVKRKDRIIAYQFAVVIDDDLQRVNHIVRGFDLLDATPKQIYLQQLLGLSTPGYMHVPVIVDEQGYKLSKQTQATAVDLTAPHRVIFKLLGLLKQNPPVELQQAPLSDQLGWAIAHWNPDLLKHVHAVTSVPHRAV